MVCAVCLQVAGLDPEDIVYASWANVALGAVPCMISLHRSAQQRPDAQLCKLGMSEEPTLPCLKAPCPIPWPLQRQPHRRVIHPRLALLCRRAHRPAGTPCGRVWLAAR